MEQGRAAHAVGAPQRSRPRLLFQEEVSMEEEAPMEVDQQDPVSDDMSE